MNQPKTSQKGTSQSRGAQRVVAIVGRPNVGKSTLVNRIVGRRAAIVQERPGVTRDRVELTGSWAGHDFTIVDTGGWSLSGDLLDAAVSRQAEKAIAQCDIAIFVVDNTVGITEADERVADLLRRTGVPVLVGANKVDNESGEVDSWAFLGLGFGSPWPISALHGRSTGDLLDALVTRLDLVEPNCDDDEASPSADVTQTEFAVAIVGRPNVGKSTLFNRLVGEERAIVHDSPGTTRDAIDTLIETEHGLIRFIDTAGLRRKSRIDESTEYYGFVRTLQAVDRADCAMLIIDATQEVTHQDQRLAERLDLSGCAVVIVLNKWDLLDATKRASAIASVNEKLSFVTYAPLIKISALTGKSTDHLLPALWAARDAYGQRIPTAALNRVLARAQAEHQPPVVAGHRPRVLYATQGVAEPPTFTLFCSRALPAPYLRYLERKMREAFDLGPTSIKLRVRTRDG